MTKYEFLSQLEDHLTGLPHGDLHHFLEYYGELIDDRMEDGASESDAVAAMGDPKTIATQVLTDFPLPKLVKEKIKPSRRMAAWEIVLICVGFPIWFSLLAAAVAVVISLYAAAFSVAVSLFASSVACGGIALGGLVAAILFFVRGTWIQGLLYIGMVLISIGLCIYLWILGLLAFKGIIKLTKVIILGIKRSLVKKEAQL